MTRPVPPRPARFTPGGVPDLPTFRADTAAFGDWVHGRPRITPRVGVVHTNAASVMSSVAAQIRWGNAGRNNTKPHWIVADGVAVKTLRTDLRGIANSTASSIEREYGEQDASFWSYAIETRDTGTRDDPAISDFVDDDAELVAVILAYESLVPGQEHPIEVPNDWNGTGVVTHTWPFPYPYFTTARGKTCPGDKKKRTFREVIVPRAREIRAAWSQPLPPPIAPPLSEEDTMPTYMLAYTGTGVDVPALTAVFGSGWVLHISAEERDVFLAAGVEIIETTNRDVYKSRLIDIGQPGKVWTS